jgi:hypothetical protein
MALFQTYLLIPGSASDQKHPAVHQVKLRMYELLKSSLRGSWVSETGFTSLLAWVYFAICVAYVCYSETRLLIILIVILPEN